MYPLKTFEPNPEEPRQVKPAYLDHNFKQKSISFFYSVCIVGIVWTWFYYHSTSFSRSSSNNSVDITAEKIKEVKRDLRPCGEHYRSDY